MHEDEVEGSVAVKMLDVREATSDQQFLENVYNEILTLWKLRNCGGVVELKEVYEDSKHIYLVLEFQASGSLLRQLLKKKTLPDHQVQFIMV